MDTIYSFRNSPTNISHNRDISSKALITIENNAPETTSPTVNRGDPALQQENNSTEKTATVATITTTNTVTARTVKNSEKLAEQQEQTPDNATTQMHLQEDDLALPPVTNPYKPRITWREAVVTTTAEQPKQTLQAATISHKPGSISWSDEPIEPRQAPQKKRPGFLARLFHYPRNS